MGIAYLHKSKSINRFLKDKIKSIEFNWFTDILHINKLIMVQYFYLRTHKLFYLSKQLL